MKCAVIAALMLGAAAVPAAVDAQAAQITQTIAGTRLDISATGEATRVPDLAIINAGVTTRATTAGAAIQHAAARMERVRAELKQGRQSPTATSRPAPSASTPIMSMKTTSRRS